MTETVVELAPRREVRPVDSFRIRLAIVRAEQGCNYDEAAAATGINSETWRLWEKGARKCSDVEGAARKINKAWGYSIAWMVLGGELVDPNGPSAPQAVTGEYTSGGARVFRLPARGSRGSICPAAPVVEPAIAS